MRCLAGLEKGHVSAGFSDNEYLLVELTLLTNEDNLSMVL